MEKSGHAVYINNAKRGEMLELTKMAVRNAAEQISIQVWHNRKGNSRA